MGIFGGTSNGESSGHINTVIGEGTTIEGSVSIPGSVRVDGVIKGEFFAGGHLALGAKGEIEAPLVKCESAHIAGRIVGDIIAPRKVHLTSTAQVFGNITTQVLVIEEGAVFNGTSKMEVSREPVMVEEK